MQKKNTQNYNKCTTIIQKKKIVQVFLFMIIKNTYVIVIMSHLLLSESDNTALGEIDHHSSLMTDTTTKNT